MLHHWIRRVKKIFSKTGVTVGVGPALIEYTLVCALLAVFLIAGLTVLEVNIEKVLFNTDILNEVFNSKDNATAKPISMLEPLEVTKTEVGTYDRIVTWGLVTNINSAGNAYTEYTGTAGQKFYPNWLLSVSKEELRDNYKVRGIITITNPATETQTVTGVSDVLNDGTIINVDCGAAFPINIGAGGTLLCSYTADLSDGSATMSTAIVTAVGSPAKTATASLSFIENLVGVDERVLTNDRFSSYRKTVSEDLDDTLPEIFECPTNPGDYTDGQYTETFINTASLNGEINLEDSASIKLNCTLDPLQVTKTEVGTYDRVITWDLVKNVNSAGNDYTEYTGTAGDKFYPNWLLSLNKEEVVGNYKVTGNITITNPAAVTQTITGVSDVLSDGTLANVDCGASFPININAGGELVCSYTALPSDGSATLNAAIVTAIGNPAQITTSSVSFTEIRIGYDSGTLTDDRFPSYSRTVTTDFNDTLPEIFECSTNPGDYTNGEYTQTIINTATLNGTFNLEDRASIKLICRLDSLEVTKTAVGTYDRTVTWDLIKNVNSVGNDYTEYTGTAGQKFYPNWLLSVNKEEVLDNFTVTGNITITNPTNLIQTVTGVSDVLNDGTEANVNCGAPFPIDINPGGTLICSYTAVPTDGSATMNTATVTAVGSPAQTATASVSFTGNLIGVDEGKLTDDRFPSYKKTVSEDFNDILLEVFKCSTDPRDYTDGEYTETFINTASLKGVINLEDSASIMLNCSLDPLEVTKTAVGTYDRTVTWDLVKNVDSAGNDHTKYIGAPEAMFQTDWLLSVNKKEVFGNYKVTGNITITNLAAVTQTVTGVSDVLNDGTKANVNCGVSFPINIDAGGTLVCSYTAEPSDDSATMNTATVTAVGNPAQTATASVSFTGKLIGYDSGTLTDNRFPTFSETVDDDASFSLSETFTCPPEEDPLYEDGVYEYSVINTAFLNDNINMQDSASITVRCETGRPHKPSLHIRNVLIDMASQTENTASGTFIIVNDSGGRITFVTLGDVYMDFIARGQAGLVGTFSADCNFTPEADGYTLAPHEAREFSYSCTLTWESGNLIDLENANQLTAFVYVYGATNQIGEYRDRLWFAISPPYKFE
jgi:hypothetical protein